MDVREKLVELQDQSDICPEGITSCIGCKYHKEYLFGNPCDVRAAIADKMIAHGVTVQEWIPVAEPPKEYRDEYGELIPFLVCEEGTDYPFRAMYDGKTWGDGIFAIHVKWWMPIPHPPKGE